MIQGGGILKIGTAFAADADGMRRVLRVARTIADLGGADMVGRIHVAEALSYRRRVPVA